MKIALYVPSWPPGFVANGIVTYTSLLAPALRRQGHEVWILASWVKGEVDPYTIDLRDFVPPPTLSTRLMYKVAPATALFNTMSAALTRAVRHLVAKHQIDVVEMEESFGWSYAVSRLNLVPVVVRLHGPWFLMGRFDNKKWNRGNQRREQLEGRGIQHAHYVTANCAETLNAVKNHYGLSLRQSRVMPNPVDPVSEEEAWDIDTCKRDSLLFVGRFDKVKGGDLVLCAFGQLATMFPNLTLTFVGPDRGVEEADGKVWTFQEFVRHNLPDQVQGRIGFLGQKSHAEVMALRTQHYITMIAAQYDTMGYMMLEAMSLGCPIISTAVGGIPEYIHDRRNGLLVPSQNVNAMVAACKELLENRELAARLGRQAWVDCRDLYNSGRAAERTIEAYSEAINSVHSQLNVA